MGQTRGYTPNDGCRAARGTVSGAVRIGLASARANAVPMAILWTFAAVLVLAYYLVPGVAGLLQPVADWQTRWGVWAAILNQVFFCAAIPTAFVLCVKRIRTGRPVAKGLCQAVWCALWGIVYVWFYALQTRLFGSDHAFATLAAKSAFDQFVWVPFVVMPINALFYLWMGSDFSLAAVRRECGSGYFRRIVMPNLIANWAVWIPVVFALYAFPYALQIQVLGLVASFWTLMCYQIGSRVCA